jgi:transcriptional regulator with XRE-family HTH domain
MSELTETLREEFKDKETRHVYCDEFLNSSIATQIKVLREQREWTQRELAERAEMRQERISVLEDVNYSSWTINVLRRLAEAFDLTLTVKFESFGEKLFAIEDMSRETLEKPSFDEDPVFNELSAIANTAAYDVDIIASYTSALNEVIKDAVKEAVAKAVFEQRSAIFKATAIDEMDFDDYLVETGDETTSGEYVAEKMFPPIENISELVN